MSWGWALASALAVSLLVESLVLRWLLEEESAALRRWLAELPDRARVSRSWLREFRTAEGRLRRE